MKSPPTPLSFALSLFTAPREAEREEAGKVSISSSSWVQVGGGDKEGVQRVHVVQEVNGNQVVDKEGEEEEVKEDKKEEVDRRIAEKEEEFNNTR